MSDENDETQPDFRTVYLDPQTGRPITAEQFQEAVARAEMATADFHTSVRRLVLVELKEDQLDTVRRLFRTLASVDNTVELVNYYEGLVDGAWHARQNVGQLVPISTPDELT